jgi:hypothetical protein
MDTVNLPPQQAQPTDQPHTPQPVSIPAGGGSKEQGPASMRMEYVTPAPVESVPQIPQELADLGIEVSPDTDKPDVPQDAQQVGVQPVKTATPVTTVPQGTVTVDPAVPTPVTYQQAALNLKSHKADESITWLSMLSKYIIEKLGMNTSTPKG